MESPLTTFGWISLLTYSRKMSTNRIDEIHWEDVCYKNKELICATNTKFTCNEKCVTTHILYLLHLFIYLLVGYTNNNFTLFTFIFSFMLHVFKF